MGGEGLLLAAFGNKKPVSLQLRMRARWRGHTQIVVEWKWALRGGRGAHTLNTEVPAAQVLVNRFRSVER
jgi:hypothetical protein